MRRGGLILILLGMALPASGQVLTADRQLAREQLEKQTPMEPRSVSQMVKMQLTDGKVEALPGEGLPKGNRLRVLPNGERAQFLINHTESASVGKMLTVYRYDFDAGENEPWITSMTARKSYLTLVTWSGDVGCTTRVRFYQTDATTQLTVTKKEGDVMRQVIRIEVANATELIRNYPEETRDYVLPAMRAIAGTSVFDPGPTDVYRILDQLPADAKWVKAVDELIPKLDAESFQERKEATAKLNQMGAPAVLALLRKDLTEIPPEARNRVDSFLMEHSTGVVNDVAKGRQDNWLLLQILQTHDEANVRKAALEYLEKSVGKKLVIDPELQGAAWDKSLAELRRTLRPTTRPAAATKPVLRKPRIEEDDVIILPK